MQRREFIQSTSSAALISILPIKHISQTLKIDSILLERNVGFTQSLNKAKSQSTTVKCKGEEIKIHAIQTGSVAVKQAHISHPTAHFLTPIKISLDTNFTEFMPIWTWVIEHKEGTIVIDTGENAGIMNPSYFKPAGKLVTKYSQRNFKFEIAKENEIGFQLRELGISNESIKNVVLTHLHIDHTDGVKDFKNVEIIINEQEYKQPTGHFPELVPNWFKPRTVRYKNDFVEVFNQAYPLTQAEDVLLIPSQGHTKHHASVLFKTDNFDILFAGDVCYNQNQLINNELPGINANYKKSRNTYDNIKTYARDRDLVFLPSHDVDSAVRLKKRQYLGK